MLGACVAFLVGLVPSPSLAEGGPRAELLEAAARAGRLGEYEFAIAALDQAYRSRPEPRLLFELGRAYQQRSARSHAARDRRMAIANYRAFLEAAARGPLRDRAQRARATLEKAERAEAPCGTTPPAAAPQTGAGQASPSEPASESSAAAEREPTANADAAPCPAPEAEPPAPTAATWLALLSPVMGAEARFDGKQARKLPLFLPIGPGKHTVEISASGYRKQTRTLSAARGLVHVVTVDLSPEPAKLTVDGTGGAELVVDGQFTGILPIEEPIDLPAGKRRLAVTLNGYRSHVAEVALAAGSTTALEIDLDMTRQRVGSSVLLALGAAGVLTGLVFGAASVAVDSSVADEPDSRDKSRDLARADGYRAVSGMAAGVGLGLSLSGAILFTFDEPVLGPEPSGATLGGLGLRGRF